MLPGAPCRRTTIEAKLTLRPGQDIEALLACIGYPRRRLRKRSVAVEVEFASMLTTVHSHEGEVHAVPGDAIITGLRGERWRVAAANFSRRYQPRPPTAMGQDGTYQSIAADIVGYRMQQPFTVLLTDGVSLLRGQPGDWLTSYADGSLGIVSSGLFEHYYEIHP